MDRQKSGLPSSGRRAGPDERVQTALVLAAGFELPPCMDGMLTATVPGRQAAVFVSRDGQP